MVNIGQKLANVVKERPPREWAFWQCGDPPSSQTFIIPVRTLGSLLLPAMSIDADKNVWPSRGEFCHLVYVWIPTTIQCQHIAYHGNWKPIIYFWSNFWFKSKLLHISPYQIQLIFHSLHFNFISGRFFFWSGSLCELARASRQSCHFLSDKEPL